MKATRRFLAGLLATSLAMCGSSFVSAATPANDGTITDPTLAGGTGINLNGEGKLEGTLDTDILRVILPTVTPDYQIDPQGLIKKSGHASVKSKVMFDYRKDNILSYVDSKGNLVTATTSAQDTGQDDEDGFVFFKNSSLVSTIDGKTTTQMLYSPTLELEAVNKSSYAVDITVEAKFIPGTTSITTSSSGTFSGTNNEVAFKIQDALDSSANTYVGTSATKIESKNKSTAGVAGVDAAYEVKYDSKTGLYSYVLNEKKLVPDKTTGNAVATPGKFKVVLNASCNPNGNWSTVTADDSKLELVWKVAKHS